MKLLERVKDLFSYSFQDLHDPSYLEPQGLLGPQNPEVIYINDCNCSNNVYVITMIEDFEYSGFIRRKIAKAPWTAGIYNSLEKADNVLRNNVTDLWETVYTYAVIEEVDVNRLYPTFATQKTHWYKFNVETEMYDEVDMPKGLTEFDKGYWG